MHSHHWKFTFTICAAVIGLAFPPAQAADSDNLIAGGSEGESRQLTPATHQQAPLVLRMSLELNADSTSTGNRAHEKMTQDPVLLLQFTPEQGTIQQTDIALPTAALPHEPIGEPLPPLGHMRHLHVPEVSQKPAIDGRLDDAIWKSAAVADGFWVSDQQRPPSEQTEVLVMTDRDNIYFGFLVHDDQPETIAAAQTHRNEGLGFDDQVMVELDTYLNRRQISSYSVNVLGVQNDKIATGRADNISWKGDWNAAAVRTDYGWSAELAIPLRILNYREQDQEFGINFARYQHRTGEWSRWADVTPQNKPEEMGRLTGLRLPPQGKDKPLTVMPYVLAGRNIPDKNGERRDTLTSAGADIRYEPRPNLTGVLSLNPDFSQIESQFTDINFSYTEKARSDPRPFFQEGADYFGSNNTFFYSNRVPDFDYGGKVFSQAGPYQIGALATHAQDNRSDGVLRVTRELDATNSASFMAMASQQQDIKNQLLLGQSSGRFASGFNYALDAASSRTSLQTGDGDYLRLAAGLTENFWSIGSTVDRISANFLTANGLLKGDLNGTRGLTAFASHFRETGDGLIRQTRGDFSWSGRDTDDGRAQVRNWYGSGSVELRQQVRASLYLSSGLYRPKGTSPGEWSDAMNHDHYWTAQLDFNTRSSRFGYGTAYSSGLQGGGDYRYLTPYLWIKPTQRTWLEASHERLNSFGEYNQTIVSGRWDVTAQDSLSARYITANGLQFRRLAYARQVRSGVDVFAVYDGVPDYPTNLSLKLAFTLP